MGRLRLLVLLAAPLVLAASLARGGEAPIRNGFVLAPSAIPVQEILPGGPPRDGIPSLDHPRHVAPERSVFGDDALVIGFAWNGEARAYPLRILDWHELVNDTVGGRPILVSYCPLCGTGMVFDRHIQDQTREFGVSGLLWRSDVLMYDRDTHSLWSQIRSQAVTGPSIGQQLELLRSEQVTLGEWRRQHPGTRVLSRNTGHDRDYLRSPYAGYRKSARTLFPVPRDRRQRAKTMTLGLRTRDGLARAYPAPELEAAGGFAEERFAGRRIRVEWDADAGVFHVDAGEGIEVIKGYWFAWAAFHPETTVFDATAARRERMAPFSSEERP